MSKSVLPVISKIFEIVINKRITCFLENNGLLIDCQHGYRKSRSVNTADQQVINNVTEARDHDLSKAFWYSDTQCYSEETVLCIYYRIRGPAHKLIKSYSS